MPITLDQLNAAEAALNTLLITGSLVEIRHGVEIMKFTAADANDLKVLIASMRMQLGLPVLGRTRGRRVVFC